jgi:hypothetical protein
MNAGFHPSWSPIPQRPTAPASLHLPTLPSVSSRCAATLQLPARSRGPCLHPPLACSFSCLGHLIRLLLDCAFHLLPYSRLTAFLASLFLTSLSPSITLSTSLVCFPLSHFSLVSSRFACLPFCIDLACRSMRVALMFRSPVFQVPARYR